MTETTSKQCKSSLSHRIRIIFSFGFLLGVMEMGVEHEGFLLLRLLLVESRQRLSCYKSSG